MKLENATSELPLSDTQRIPRPSFLIECRNLHKTFGRTVALAGVDIGIAQTEIVALLGPSGSGKSTLLHCLAGLERPDSGEVWALGHSITTMQEPHLTRLRRDRFGFVFQFPSLISELSARENVALAAWLAGVDRSTAWKRADDLLGRLGILKRADHLPGQLSGGEAQRVVLARALINNPQILFADEPTGALDSENAVVVCELLVRMAKEQGCAVLLVTHSPTIASYADRKLLLRDGQVVG